MYGTKIFCIVALSVPLLCFLSWRYFDVAFLSAVALRRQPNVTLYPEDFQHLRTSTGLEELPYCVENITDPIFRFYDKENFTVSDVIQSHPSALSGRWHPKDCRAKFRLAVMVPLRGRGTHNFTFLMNMHAYFQMHQYDYGIFIIEQTSRSRFNRGMLFNVGFLEINKRWPNMYDCFALHDVDIFPMNTSISYQCFPDATLVHLANAVSKFKFKLPYGEYTGGVSVVNKETYLKMNGFSNAYFGWGGEDDDFSNRLRNIKGSVKRYPPAETMMYMLGHGDRDRNRKRVDLLHHWKERISLDGVHNIPPYDIKEVTTGSCAIKITVELYQNLIMKDSDKIVINRQLQ